MTAALIGLPALAATAKPKPKPNNPLSEEAARIVSYTIYAEARGEPFKGKWAVAAVIQTRARLKGLSLVEVCLQDKQFSCWNDIDAVPNYYITGEGMKPADLKARSDCYGLAWPAMTSRKEWAYLTHFYNPQKANPSWARNLRGKRTIGHHVFGYMD